MKREDELVAAGWERRFIACEPRLSEMVATYKEIGFEVLLEPLPSNINVSWKNKALFSI